MEGNKSQVEHKKKIASLREKIKGIHIHKSNKFIDVSGRFPKIKFRNILGKKKQNQASLQISSSTKANNKLATIKNNLPAPIQSVANKVGTANKVALATYYRARPKNNREKFIYLLAILFALTLIVLSATFGVLLKTQKFKPISQSEWEYNIPFYIGGDSLWLKTPTTPESDAASSFTNLHTHILVEYSYKAENNKSKQKLLFSTFSLDSNAGYSSMKQQSLPMDITEPITFYIYNDITGKNEDIHFHIDSHQIKVPFGKDVIKFTNDPQTSIYPTSYQNIERNGTKTSYSCQNILSSYLSSGTSTNYSGLSLQSSLQFPPFVGPDKRPKVMIAKGKNPAFGIYITNYVNYIPHPSTFGNASIFNPIIVPNGLLIPSNCFVVSFYFVPNRTKDVKKVIQDKSNYGFDADHFNQSTALDWQTEK